jgi:hypothetical protein
MYMQIYIGLQYGGYMHALGKIKAKMFSVSSGNSGGRGRAISGVRGRAADRVPSLEDS